MKKISNLLCLPALFFVSIQGSDVLSPPVAGTSVPQSYNNPKKVRFIIESRKRFVWPAVLHMPTEGYTVAVLKEAIKKHLNNVHSYENYQLIVRDKKWLNQQTMADIQQKLWRSCDIVWCKDMASMHNMTEEQKKDVNGVLSLPTHFIGAVIEQPAQDIQIDVYSHDTASKVKKRILEHLRSIKLPQGRLFKDGVELKDSQLIGNPAAHRDKYCYYLDLSEQNGSSASEELKKKDKGYKHALQ